MTEQIVHHEIVIALRMIVAQADILIQVIGGHTRKIHGAAGVHFRHFGIGGDGGGAGGKSQHRMRVFDHLRGEKRRRRRADSLGVFICPYIHSLILQSMFFSIMHICAEKVHTHSGFFFAFSGYHGKMSKNL